MDNCSNQHIVHAGWLIKSPPEKRIWKTKWRRRWFVLKLSGQIPGQYVLEYFIDQSCKKLKGTIDLDQCEQVDAGLQLEIRKENYEHMFDVRTPRRIYYLVAKNEEEMNKWVECVCAVCGLKMEPSELSLLPPVSTELNEERYSPQPSQTEQQQHMNSQLVQQIKQHQNNSPLNNNSSTSESSLATLNYIPISECYTGKARAGGSSPPPRPPKPIGLGGLQQAMEKSQSSLALWPYEQEQPIVVANNNKSLSPHSSPLALANNSLGSNDRSVYLNSNSNTAAIDASQHHHHNMYDTWHSKTTSKISKPSFTATRPSVVNNSTFFVQSQQQPNNVLQQNQNHQPLPPPMVNRDLKPQRRKFIDPNSSEFQRISSSLNRHTLPRPPASGGNSMRIAIHNDEKLHNNNKPHLSHSVLAEHKKLSFPNNNQNGQPTSQQQTTISLPLSAINNQHNANFNNESSNEIQYLDLDLDSESTNSQSPRTPLTSSAGTGGASVTDNACVTTNNSVNNNNNNSNSFDGGVWNGNNNIPLNSGSLSALADAYNNNTNGQIGNLNHPTLNINGITSTNNQQQQQLLQQQINHSSTVYKKVDFVKTKAFNEMRVNVDLYRNGQ